MSETASHPWAESNDPFESLLGKALVNTTDQTNPGLSNDLQLVLPSFSFTPEPKPESPPSKKAAISLAKKMGKARKAVKKVEDDESEESETDPD